MFYCLECCESKGVQVLIEDTILFEWESCRTWFNPLVLWGSWDFSNLSIVFASLDLRAYWIWIELLLFIQTTCRKAIYCLPLTVDKHCYPHLIISGSCCLAIGEFSFLDSLAKCVFLQVIVIILRVSTFRVMFILVNVLRLLCSASLWKDALNWGTFFVARFFYHLLKMDLILEILFRT